jgi:hypothetical protein
MVIVSFNDSAAERIAFLRATFTAFANVVESVEVSQRTDLYAVGIHLYSGMSFPAVQFCLFC